MGTLSPSLFHLQHFSKLCRIPLNDFRCATVSHSSAWRKSWDKHDFNEVASSILARNIIIIIYWQPSNSSNIHVKLYSVILTYILILIHFCDDINMLPQWFQRMLWARIELATSLKSCLPQLCITQNWGWLWHNENHLTQFRIILKSAVNYKQDIPRFALVYVNAMQSTIL